MNTYQFNGTYVYILQAESEEAAREEMNNTLGEILFKWDVHETHHIE